MRFAATRLATGPQIHYAEHGDPGGEAVVFLHGWPDSWFSFSRVVPRMRQQYCCFVLDQRGFGDSERPAHGYGIHDLAADAVAFLDSVSAERATIVGHSLGSFIARQVALAHPDRVSRLVLIGSAWSPANPVMREVAASIRDLADPIPIEFVREFQASTAYKPLPEPFFDRLVAESLKLPARLWREVFDGLMSYQDLDDLTRITAPTLLLWGDRDALFSREDQDRLLAAIRGAKLRVYPETGHCPNWESPEQLAADLDAFISGN